MKREKIVKSSDKYANSQFWIQYGIDLDKRKIMLSEDVDEGSIGWIIRGIQKMAEESREAPIDIYVSTYGGDVYEKLALYDVIRSLDYLTVRTHALGKVMSAGITIFLAGDERYSYPSTTFMAHSISSSTYGKLFEMETEVEECKRLMIKFVAIYADRTNLSKKQWQQKLKHKDLFFDVDKAKAWGLITHEH